MAPRSTLPAAMACAVALLSGCGSGPSTPPVAGPPASEPAPAEPDRPADAKSAEPGPSGDPVDDLAVPRAQPKKGKPLAASPTASPSSSARPDAGKPTTRPVTPARGMTALELKVLELTNAERAKGGCPALRGDARLATAARLHSQDMAAQNYFSHDSKDGSSPWDRIKRQGYTDPGAENIAAGYPTPAAVMKGWMNSPGHRANIMNCKLKALGVGVQTARGGKGPWWTQDFGWS
ncbi:CAP domain-containing protein [Actinocorallia longicatena]|uniref:CAP domain-containing protein n=1 Tax=Actinocorallia longicatena TaxID=111803 RepID=A0ABP6QCR3_9ACTN